MSWRPRLECLCSSEWAGDACKGRVGPLLAKQQSTTLICPVRRRTTRMALNQTSTRGGTAPCRDSTISAARPRTRLLPATVATTGPSTRTPALYLLLPAAGSRHWAGARDSLVGHLVWHAACDTPRQQTHTRTYPTASTTSLRHPQRTPARLVSPVLSARTHCSTT